MDTIETPHGKTRPDPMVQAAIGHWAPRFVTNGVPLTDFQEVIAGITRRKEWCADWMARQLGLPPA